jgi:hypothetical protein
MCFIIKNEQEVLASEVMMAAFTELTKKRKQGE